MGGIWEIIFSLPPGAVGSCGVPCCVIGSARGWICARNFASNSSRSATGECECEWMAARARRESSQRWNVALISLTRNQLTGLPEFPG